jgi:hypothetical protein
MGPVYPALQRAEAHLRSGEVEAVRQAISRYELVELLREASGVRHARAPGLNEPLAVVSQDLDRSHGDVDLAQSRAAAIAAPGRSVALLQTGMAGRVTCSRPACGARSPNLYGSHKRKRRSPLGDKQAAKARRRENREEREREKAERTGDSPAQKAEQARRRDEAAGERKPKSPGGSSNAA